MNRAALEQKVRILRSEGKTYKEICDLLKVKIKKSTFSYWCKGVRLPSDYQRKIKEHNKASLIKARFALMEASRIRREKKILIVHNSYHNFSNIIKNKEVAKIVLSTLYLGEGYKDPKRGYIAFGNSSGDIIKLFLHLLRYCYNIDESKFRGTVQCRADQNIQELESFWSKVTRIPLSQFYKARIDRRTLGKPSKKLDYKGVLRVDYFSADILLEMLEIPKILMGL